MRDPRGVLGRSIGLAIVAGFVILGVVVVRRVVRHPQTDDAVVTADMAAYDDLVSRAELALLVSQCSGWLGIGRGREVVRAVSRSPVLSAPCAQRTRQRAGERQRHQAEQDEAAGVVPPTVVAVHGADEPSRAERQRHTEWQGPSLAQHELAELTKEAHAATAVLSRVSSRICSCEMRKKAAAR